MGARADHLVRPYIVRERVEALTQSTPRLPSLCVQYACHVLHHPPARLVRLDVLERVIHYGAACVLFLFAQVEHRPRLTREGAYIQVARRHIRHGSAVCHVVVVAWAVVVVPQKAHGPLVNLRAEDELIFYAQSLQGEELCAHAGAVASHTHLPEGRHTALLWAYYF